MSRPKKKLLLRVGTFPSPSETFITLQAKLASDLGFDVFILADRKMGLEDSSQPEIMLEYDLLARTTELRRLEPSGGRQRVITLLKILASVVPLDVLRTLDYLNYGSEGLKGNYVLHYEEVRPFIDADVVHIQFGTSKYPFDALKASGLFKGKVVTTFHGFDAHFGQVDQAERMLFYSQLFKYGEAFTANSKFLEQRLIDLGCPRDKLSVIPMPVDTDYFRPLKSSTEGDEIAILSVGRLVELKGHAFGIRAVRRLMDKGYKLRYDIVGVGEEKDSLEALIAELGLQESVTLCGARSQSEVRQLMQRSDLYLMTSAVDKTGRREAQGLVSGEAQACGLPMIAFKSGGVPSTLADGQTGFLVPEKEVEAMAERIAYLIDHPEMRRQMGEEARKFIEQNFSLQVISQQWADLYSRLLESSGTRPK